MYGSSSVMAWVSLPEDHHFYWASPLGNFIPLATVVGPFTFSAIFAGGGHGQATPPRRSPAMSVGLVHRSVSSTTINTFSATH